MTGDSKSMRFAVTYTLAIAVFSLAGCSPAGPPSAAVSGTVRLDGKPLVEGAIRFVPVDGTPGQKMSIPILDGTFAIAAANGPAVGRHRIEIESTDTAGLGMDDEDAIHRLRATGTTRVAVVRVPRWYNTASMLCETLQADVENELNFELSRKRPR